MMAGAMRALARCSLGGLGVSVALAEETPDALAKKLAEFKGSERGEVTPVTGSPPARTFLRDRFCLRDFRQYPTAVVPPQPFQANILFIGNPDGSVGHIRDATALEGFFRATLAPVRTATEAKEAAKA